MTHRYQTSTGRCLRRVVITNQQSSLLISNRAIDGTFTNAVVVERITIIGVRSQPKAITVQGKPSASHQTMFVSIDHVSGPQSGVCVRKFCGIWFMH